MSPIPKQLQSLSKELHTELQSFECYHDQNRADRDLFSI